MKVPKFNLKFLLNILLIIFILWLNVIKINTNIFITLASLISYFIVYKIINNYLSHRKSATHGYDAVILNINELNFNIIRKSENRKRLSLLLKIYPNKDMKDYHIIKNYKVEIYSSSEKNFKKDHNVKIFPYDNSFNRVFIKDTIKPAYKKSFILSLVVIFFFLGKKYYDASYANISSSEFEDAYFFKNDLTGKSYMIEVRTKKDIKNDKDFEFHNIYDLSSNVPIFLNTLDLSYESKKYNNEYCFYNNNNEIIFKLYKSFKNYDCYKYDIQKKYFYKCNENFLNDEYSDDFCNSYFLKIKRTEQNYFPNILKIVKFNYKSYLALLYNISVKDESGTYINVYDHKVTYLTSNLYITNGNKSSEEDIFFFKRVAKLNNEKTYYQIEFNLKLLKELDKSDYNKVIKLYVDEEDFFAFVKLKPFSLIHFDYTKIVNIDLTPYIKDDFYSIYVNIDKLNKNEFIISIEKRYKKNEISFLLYNSEIGKIKELISFSLKEFEEDKLKYIYKTSFLFKNYDKLKEDVYNVLRN